MDEFYLIVALLLAGMVLMLLEILTPSFGLLILLGAASFVGAVVAGFARGSTTGTVLLVAVAVFVPVYLWVLVKFLPGSPLGRRMFLSGRVKGTSQATPQASLYQSMVGCEGVSESLLRPGGTVRIDGKRFSASAEHGSIPPRTAVRVIRAADTYLVVRPLEGEDAGGGAA